MSDIMAAVMIVAAPILTAVFAVGILALIGLVTYDVVSARRAAVALAKAEAGAASADHVHQRAVRRTHLERGVARAFVILGGLFWGICLVAVVLWHQRGMETFILIALVPFLMNLACLIIGWRWERTASVMLTITVALAVWWGVAAGYEVGVWMLFTVLLIGPMLTAAVLFWLARQGEIDLALHLASQPALSPVPIDR